MNPDNATDEDECHCRHCHHTIINISGVVCTLGDDLEAEQRATTEEFAEGTDDDKYHGIAKSVSYTVEERRPRLVLHGECLKTAHENTVGDDQTNIHRELHTHIVGERLQYLGHDGHQGCHHDKLYHDADTGYEGVK